MNTKLKVVEVSATEFYQIKQLLPPSPAKRLPVHIRILKITKVMFICLDTPQNIYSKRASLLEPINKL